MSEIKFSEEWKSYQGNLLSAVTFPKEGEREPYIDWLHPDGPLLTCRNGELHWLSYFERFKIRFGYLTIYDLEHKVMSPWRSKVDG